MPPTSDVHVVSGQIDTSISGNVVQTSISGNVVTLNSPTSVGAPIVLTGTIIVGASGIQLPDIPVTSGVRFQTIPAATYVLGGLGDNMASFTDTATYTGIRIVGDTETFPVTNLNQLSVAANFSGKINYFAISISGV